MSNQKKILPRLNCILYLPEESYIIRKGKNMDKQKLERISELSRKDRSDGLTAEEKEEQKNLREEYLSFVRKNFRQTLENITLQ